MIQRQTDLVPTLLAVALAILLPFLLILCRRRFLPSSSSTPCPESYPLIGNLPSLLRNRHRLHDWITDMLAATPSSTLRVPSILRLTSPGICTADPANVAHLLSSNFHNYVKGHRFRSHLGDLLGRGIFVSDGHLWFAQRKSASHVFSTRSLKLFAARVVGGRATSSLLPSLSDLADRGAAFDLQLVLQEFAFRNLCELAFGVDTAGEELGAGFFQAFDDAVEVAFSRMLSPVPALWKVKRWLSVGSEKRFKEAVKEIDRLAFEVIRLKEKKLLEEDKNGGADQDLLTRFMALTSEDVESNNWKERRQFLRDMIVNFFLAGKDSTSTALTWFFWLVAGNRHCEERILDELSSSLPPGDPVPGYEELKRLDYLHAAITESMRLFPPVPINSRQVESDDVLPDGTRVTRGWFADYSAYAMGRMERVWGPDCREFRPERWLSTEEGRAVRFRACGDPFGYAVFHGGPRVCLGKDMAYIQMKAIAATVMREFEVVPVDGGATPERMVSPPYAITALLKMKGGLPVRIRRRAREARAHR